MIDFKKEMIIFGEDGLQWLIIPSAYIERVSEETLDNPMGINEIVDFLEENQIPALLVTINNNSISKKEINKRREL